MAPLSVCLSSRTDVRSVLLSTPIALGVGPSALSLWPGCHSPVPNLFLPLCRVLVTYVPTYLLSDWVTHYPVDIDLQGDRVVFNVLFTFVWLTHTLHQRVRVVFDVLFIFLRLTRPLHQRVRVVMMFCSPSCG